MQIHGIHAPNDENPAPAGVPCTGGTFCGPLECRHQDGVLHAPSVVRPDPRFQAFHLHWKSILLLRLGRQGWEMLGRSWKVQKDAGLVRISYVDVCSFVFIYELLWVVNDGIWDATISQPVHPVGLPTFHQAIAKSGTVFWKRSFDESSRRMNSVTQDFTWSLCCHCSLLWRGPCARRMPACQLTFVSGSFGL